MNKEQLESQWVQLRTFLRDKWGNLTEEDIRQINGRYDTLIAKLQQRYGYTREESEAELRNWVLEREPKTFAHDKPFVRARDEDLMRAKKSDASSFLTWLLALGIPLLLLASFLMYENSKTPTTFTTNPPTARDERVISVTPADRALVDNIRQAFARSGGTVTVDFDNISIQSSNGVVTVNGSVVSEQQKDAIGKIISNINGVRQVNNQLIVQ